MLGVSFTVPGGGIASGPWRESTVGLVAVIVGKVFGMVVRSWEVFSNLRHSAMIRKTDTADPAAGTTGVMQAEGPSNNPRYLVWIGL